LQNEKDSADWNGKNLEKRGMIAATVEEWKADESQRKKEWRFGGLNIVRGSDRPRDFKAAVVGSSSIYGFGENWKGMEDGCGWETLVLVFFWQ
jgi:hypothetical protein